MALGTAAGAQDKSKDTNEGKVGKTIGTLTEKSDTYIEVKADGEEKARPPTLRHPHRRWERL